VVWANEVHRLLTYYSTSCYQTCCWWHICVSAGQCTSASVCKTIALLERKTPDFISPDLWPPTALTSIWSITSSGGSCNSGSIRRRSRMWMNSWTGEATGWNLGWSGAEHYWHCYQCTEKPSACLCLRKGPTYWTSTVAVEQLNIWINSQPEWPKCKPNVIYACYFNKVIILPCWFASASFSGPLLSVEVEFCLWVCLFVCLSATLRSNISKTKGARRKVTIGSL